MIKMLTLSDKAIAISNLINEIAKSDKITKQYADKIVFEMDKKSAMMVLLKTLTGDIK